MAPFGSSVSSHNRPRQLIALLLLTLITTSPLVAGFLPPVALALRERSSQDGAAGQATPEPWEAQLARARQMRDDGRYEDAAEAYRAALGRAPNAAAVALSAAEAELAAKDYRAVLDLTNMALASNPAASDAHALRGEAFAALGDSEQSLASFRSYLAAEPVGGYVAFRAAEVASTTGDVNAAGDLYRRSLDLGMSAWWEASAARRIGGIYTTANAPADAVAWFERARSEAADIERRGLPVWYDGELVRRNGEAGAPAIIFELAGARRAAGLIDEAVDAYSDVVALYPAVPQADKALAALAELDALEAVSSSARGLVHLNAGRPREAIAAFDEFRATSADEVRLARAAYYMGLARRDAGERAAAREDLTTMARLYPDSPLAPEALYQAGRIAEAMSLAASDIVRSYVAVADAHPASDQAGRALARAGSIALESGDAGAAREIWGRLAQHPDATARAQGLFMLGRVLLVSGDTADGRAALSEATAQAPLTYEGLRARELLDRGPAADPYRRGTSGPLSAPPGGDNDACTDWIATWSGPPSAEGAASRTLGKIDRLALIGMDAAAQTEALEAIPALMTAPRELHALARGLADRHLYPQSLYAALRLGSAGPGGSIDQAPACLQRLAYPLAYWDLVEQQAEERGIDQALLVSLLRQESWFGPHALSSADARGLSQVVPSTGAGIARSLGRTGFDAENLYRPRESITFGAWYLAEQIRILGGRPVLALAAYNGGAASTTRWAGRNLAIDADAFVDAIDFAETRAYVRSIYQIYSRYLQLYG